jgi:hypothetical protein
VLLCPVSTKRVIRDARNETLDTACSLGQAGLSQ